MSVLKINEELFIGAGGHQATYIHLIDPRKCIKIPHMKDDGDLKKKMRYRRMCAKKLAKSKLVSEFFWTVETNSGIGYVFGADSSRRRFGANSIKSLAVAGQVESSQIEEHMSVLKINEELFIGAGGHQATYIHPIDPHKCIKIPHMKDDGDVKKEMRYRRMCAKKLAKSKLVTEFFGTVETNLGLGYVFERVLDYNGKTSLDMKKFLPTTKPDKKTLQRIWTILLNFKSDFLQENIAIVDTDIENFMVQEHAPGAYRVRIVDNIGTPVLIPLVYWFDFAAAWKAKRYWNKIVDWLAENYPEIIPPELVAQLKEK